MFSFHLFFLLSKINSRSFEWQPSIFERRNMIRCLTKPFKWLLSDRGSVWNERICHGEREKKRDQNKSIRCETWRMSFERDFQRGNQQLKSAPLIVKLPIYHRDYHCVWLALVCCFEDPLPHYCPIIVIHSSNSLCLFIPESIGWLNISIIYNKCSICWK